MRKPSPVFVGAPTARVSGPRTDADGRVLDVDGEAIRGLYAAGNVMASPTGMVYGGAGATLAVAGVWGLSAGRAAVHDRIAVPSA